MALPFDIERVLRDRDALLARLELALALERRPLKPPPPPPAPVDPKDRRRP